MELSVTNPLASNQKTVCWMKRTMRNDETFRRSRAFVYHRKELATITGKCSVWQPPLFLHTHHPPYLHCFLTLPALAFLGDEGVLYRFHAILRADQHHRRAPAHHQPQVPRIVRQLVIVRIAQKLYRIVQHQVQQRIITLQHAGRFPSTRKLDPYRLLQIFAQIEDGFLSSLFFIVASAAAATTSSTTSRIAGCRWLWKWRKEA